MLQRIWRDCDWTIIICTLLLVAMGVVAIGSATHINQTGLHFSTLVAKQLIFFLINVALVIGIQFMDYLRCTALDSVRAYYAAAIRVF